MRRSSRGSFQSGDTGAVGSEAGFVTRRNGVVLRSVIGPAEVSRTIVKVRIHGSRHACSRPDPRYCEEADRFACR